MQRLVWVGAFSHEAKEMRKKIVTSALENGFSDIVLSKEDRELEKVGKFNSIIFDGNAFLLHGEEIGRYVAIKGPEDQKAAMGLRGRSLHVVVSAEDWKVIPLENLIAHFQGSGSRLLASARDVDEVKLFFETLEVGTDGVLFSPRDPKALGTFRRYVEAQSPRVELKRGVVKAIRQLGLGDRVCVDTCSMLSIGEGMLVGNQSSGLFLVHSESMDSLYVASRPFRVNAGPVHAYILLPDGGTKYLSELKSGDEVLAVSRDGTTRPVVIGRVKIERRPLLLVEAEADGKEYSTIVQNAETIRLVSHDSAVAVPELKVGDSVLLRIEEGGRHFGTLIKETIKER